MSNDSSEGAKILAEINSLLGKQSGGNDESDSEDFEQDGGAKKKRVSSKKSKKESVDKPKKKRTSGKKKKSTGKKQSGGKRKKSSGRKQKREMPKAMQDIQEVRRKIVAALASPDIKNDIPMAVVASSWLKSNGSDLDKALKAISSNKDDLKKQYNKVKKEQAEKREAKKAAKSGSK